jgi:hypothetical protein
MKPDFKAAGAILVALLFVAGVSLAQPPLADYGDAPDPTFPSLFNSMGPYHTNLTDSYVGWMSTPEPDALIPNADLDDGAPLIFAALINGVWTGWVYVPITIDPSAPGPAFQTRFLNVLLDGNSSGTWCDQAGEWIVRNYILPNYFFVHFPGQTVWYCIGGFSWVNDFSGLHFLRVTVSDAPVLANVPLGWDGSWAGGFILGETEDWELQWFYDPPQPPDPPGPPPHDPINPPAPVPVPDCNKTATVSQTPPPTHRGHSGNFGLVVKNASSNHPIHIVEGPFPTDENGSPIDIDVESLESTVLQPGQSATAAGSWDFHNPPANATWCNWDVVVDPLGQYVVVVNVGDYDSPTGQQPTGGSFEELGIPTLTGMGLALLILALISIAVFFIVRRRRMIA